MERNFWLAGALTFALVLTAHFLSAPPGQRIESDHSLAANDATPNPVLDTQTSVLDTHESWTPGPGALDRGLRGLDTQPPLSLAEGPILDSQEWGHGSIFGERAVAAGQGPVADLASMEAVVFDRQGLDAAEPGSVLPLAMPHLAGRYDWLVEEAIVDSDGVRTLRGQLLHQQQVWPVVFTLGASSVLATLHTPEGAIEVEAFGAVAWIVASADFQVRARPHLSDWMLPERPPAVPPMHL
ncbi:MAG: hypothetical protein JJT88_19890 [Gammaproteobacteria bacterium]|nr:hypothetical protein [Gammaproteobacteria bacterium]